MVLVKNVRPKEVQSKQRIFGPREVQTKSVQQGSDKFKTQILIKCENLFVILFCWKCISCKIANIVENVRK